MIFYALAIIQSEISLNSPASGVEAGIPHFEASLPVGSGGLIRAIRSSLLEVLSEVLARDLFQFDDDVLAENLDL